MADSASNTLLSLLSRKPAARPTTPEEEMELLNQQASILASLKEEKPTTTSDLISQALAGALPLIGGALAGDRLGLAAGASAGAGAIETYRKRMEEEQERQKTTSLLELANVQNRLDAAALAKQEQAKAEASLAKTRASTMLGQIEAAGGSPEDYLNYVRGQSQRASNVLSAEEAAYMNSIATQRGLSMNFEPGVPKSVAMEALRNPQMIEKTAPPSQAKLLGAEAQISSLEESGMLPKEKADAFRGILGQSDLSSGQVDEIQNQLGKISGSVREAQRGTKAAQEIEQVKARKAGTAAISSLADLTKRVAPEAGETTILQMTPKVSPKEFSELSNDSERWGRVQNTITKMEEFFKKTGGKIPIKAGPERAEFNRLRETLVDNVREMRNMGANFTTMERGNVISQLFGVPAPGEEPRVFDPNAALVNFFESNPARQFAEFRTGMEDEYARATLSKGFFDTAAIYRPNVLDRYGNIPGKVKQTLLLQNNPELLRRKVEEDAKRRAANIAPQ